MIKGVTKEWALTMGFCVLTLLALGLGLTWVNIERVDMAYELKRLQTEIDTQEALISKLEVERNTMLTPERLRVLAAQYGLTQARPGQIRRLSAGGEEMPSPVIKGVAVVTPEKPKKGEKDPAKTSKDAKSGKDAKDAKASRDAKSGKDTKDAKASGETKDAKASGDEKAPKATDGKDKAAGLKAEKPKDREPRRLDEAPAATDTERPRKKTT